MGDVLRFTKKLKRSPVIAVILPQKSKTGISGDPVRNVIAVIGKAKPEAFTATGAEVATSPKLDRKPTRVIADIEGNQHLTGETERQLPYLPLAG